MKTTLASLKVICILLLVSFTNKLANAQDTIAYSASGASIDMNIFPGLTDFFEASASSGSFSGALLDAVPNGPNDLGSIGIFYANPMISGTYGAYIDRPVSVLLDNGPPQNFDEHIGVSATYLGGPANNYLVRLDYNLPPTTFNLGPNPSEQIKLLTVSYEGSILYSYNYSTYNGGLLNSVTGDTTIKATFTLSTYISPVPESSTLWLGSLFAMSLWIGSRIQERLSNRLSQCPTCGKRQR